MISPSLRRRRFLLFLTGGISQQVGMYVHGGVVTLSAIILLEASYTQIGLMQAGGIVLALLLALPLGVLIDRARRRSALVVTGLLSAALLASVAVAAWLDTVALPHLAVMVVALEVLRTTGELARNAYLPTIVERGQLVPVNAAFFVVASIGSSYGVWLLSGHPDAVSSVVLPVAAVALAAAALLFCRIDAPEEPPGPRTNVWRETVEGVRFTLTHPVLRAIAVYLTASLLFEPVIEEATRLPDLGKEDPSIDLLRPVIHMAPLVGALLAVLLHRRIGAFRLAWLAALVTQPFTLLLALNDTAWGLTWYMIGRFVPWAGLAVTAVALLSYRQVITPGRLLGRTGATLILFAGLAGVAGSFLEVPTKSLGPLPSLALGTAGLLAAAVPLLKVRHLAEPARPPVIPLTSSPPQD